MDKSTHEENLSPTQQTNSKQIKFAVTFLTSYKVAYNVTNKYKKFGFAKLITDKDGFYPKTTLPGAYELESSNDEIRRNIIEEGLFNGVDFLFIMKPIFSTLGSIRDKNF